MKRFFSAAATVLVISAVVLGGFYADEAFAKNITYAAGEIKVPLPDKWTCEETGSVLVINSPDGNIKLVFNIQEGADLAAATEGAKAAIEKTSDDVKKRTGQIIKFEFKKSEKLDINGMEALVTGGGLADGNVITSIFAIKNASNRTVLFYYNAMQESAKKYNEDIMKLIQGIKPVKRYKAGEPGSILPIEGKVEIPLPQGWTKDVEDNGAYIIHSPDNKFTLNIALYETAKPEKAVSSLKKVASDMAKQFSLGKIKFDRKSPGNVAGLKSAEYRGLTADGRMKFHLSAIELPSKNYLMCFMFTTKEEYDKRISEAEKIINGIRPLK